MQSYFPKSCQSHTFCQSSLAESMQFRLIDSSMKDVYPEDIECVMDPVGGKGGVFIGNLESAENPKTLSRLGIKAVISCAKGHILPHSAVSLPHYLYLPAEDHEQFDMSRYFAQSSDFIDMFRKKTNVLVHCLAGVSRSVTIVLAYMIIKKGCRLDEAYDLVRSRRSKIHPNTGFLRQLRDLERRLRREGRGGGRMSMNVGQTMATQLEFSLGKENIRKTHPAGTIYQLTKKTCYDEDYDKQLWRQIESLKIESTIKPTRDRALSKAKQSFSSIQKSLSSIQKDVMELRSKLSRPPSQPSLSRLKRAPLGLLN